MEFTAERACVNLLNADCKSAVAIFAKCEGEQLSLGARVMLPNGTKMIECFLDASASEAEALGTKVAKKLIEQGALQILEESHRF